MSRIPARIEKIAPCLRRSAYRREARGFIAEALRIPGTTEGQFLKTFLCYALFHRSEALLGNSAHPLPAFRSLLRDLAQLTASTRPALPRLELALSAEESGAIETITGKHYQKLFGAFRAADFAEAARLLKTRFARNRVPRSVLRGKALDAGCGGGRYTVALKRLGFERVTGLDISQEMIRDARRRMRALSISGIHFIPGSALKLPFKENSFDFVFSNGVLHHTTSWKRGVAELLRVLKPGGAGFLYLIEEPGGIFWDRIELLRILMRGVPRDYASYVLELLGVPPNRRFYILDHIMVPINLRLRPSQIERELVRNGAVEIRRFERGTDFDRREQIWRRIPHASLRYGVGENRYFFRKRHGD